MTSNEDQQALAHRTLLEREGKALLIQEDLDEGTTTFPTVQASQQQATARVQTNLYSIDITKKVEVHQYKLEGYFLMKNEKKYFYSKPHRATPVNAERTLLGRRALQIMEHAYPTLFTSANQRYYDGAYQLYTLNPIALMAGAPEMTFEVQTSQWTIINDLVTDASALSVTLKTVERRLKLSELVRAQNATTQALEQQTELMQFIDIATSEYIISNGRHVVYRNGSSYLLDPVAQGYRANDLPDVGAGAYAAIGAAKSTRIIQNDGQLHAALQIEPRISAFHSIQSISEKVLSQWPRIEAQISGFASLAELAVKGVYVRFTHRRGMMRKIQGITRTDAHSTLFETEEGQISVAAYFEQRYGIELSHPKLPCLIFDSAFKAQKGAKDYAPMEICQVADDQRLLPLHETLNIKNAMLRSNTRVPAVYQRELDITLKSFAFGASEGLSEAGIAVSDHAIETTARQLAPPSMVYDREQVSQYDPLKGSWRMQRYFSPARIDCWALYGCVRRRSTNQGMADDELVKFAKAFIYECKNKGMEIGNPAEARLLDINDHEEMSGVFDIAKKNECTYIVLITAREDEGIHMMLKNNERLADLVTQNVTLEVARAAAGIQTAPKRQTMENLVSKANEKNGGCNYCLADSLTRDAVGANDLFIGIATNTANYGATELRNMRTVVGYAANDRVEPISLTGNYVFQEGTRLEKVGVIRNIVETVLQRSIANRGRTPLRVFLYRDGCSEGDYDYVMRYEVPLVRKLVEKANAKLVFIVPNFMHGIRFFPAQAASPSARAHEQNLPCGTVIDSGVMNAYTAEWFLLGCHPRLGTARIPRYTVIANDAQVDMGEAQRLTYQLCFAHQIISGSTGRPSPLHVAVEMAKRGRAIYTVVSSGSDREQQFDDRDCALLSEELNYARNVILRNRRFNA